MRKIPTLFKRDSEDRSRVVDERNPDALWVGGGPDRATRKYDGTCVMLDEDGDWWARREVKAGKASPPGFVAIETDPATGKTVGWEPAEQSPFIKFLREALGNPYQRRTVGTYELIGPKVNGNPERVEQHELIAHADAEDLGDVPLGYDELADWLGDHEYEGIVWHHPDGRMAKIKRRDFGHRG